MSDIIFALADTVPIWDSIAVMALGALAVGLLLLAVTVYGEDE